MGFWSEFTGHKYADFAKSDSKLDIGIPSTASSTILDAVQKRARIPRSDLEIVYMNDGQTFKMVNSYKQLLIQAGYKIVADNKTNQKQYDDFFKNMGKVGLHYKLEPLLERIILDCTMYGVAYVERIYDETGKYVIDLKPIDAKLMDYVRDMKYVMLTDFEQNPLGYVMYVGYYTDAIGDRYPQGARIIPGYIFLRPERIAQFVINPFGNGFEGLGIIEPVYNQITRKMKIEQTASNAIFNSADSLIYAIVGDNTRNASVPMMNATLDTLKKWTTNKRAVFQYPTQVGSLPVLQSPEVQNILHYLRQDQAAAGGMSLSMAIGGGESNNKSTMNTERRDFNTRLNAMARSISEQFSSKILDVIYKVNGYGSKAVMRWNTVSVDDKMDMVTQLDILAKDGAVTLRELRNYAKNVYDLETNDEEWEESLLDQQSQTEVLPEMPNQTPGSALDSGKEIANSQVTPQSNPKLTSIEGSVQSQGTDFSNQEPDKGTIYFIRHGKTALNKGGSVDSPDRIRGWQDIPLDETGLKEAEGIPKLFKNIRLGKIYTSDLTRAQQTGTPLSQSQNLTIHPTRSLRPWHLGEYEGQESSKVAPLIAEHVKKPDEKIPKGESFNDFRHRTIDMFKKLIEEAQDSDKPIAVVTHYRDLKLLDGWISAGMKDYDIDVNKFINYDIKPGSVLKLVPDKKGYSLREIESGPQIAEHEKDNPKENKVLKKVKGNSMDTKKNIQRSKERYEDKRE